MAANGVRWPAMIFQVTETEAPLTRTGRSSHSGREWKPPKDHRKNHRRSSNVLPDGGRFFCNGTTIQAFDQSPYSQWEPDDLRPWRLSTCSVYYNDGMFWTLPYDATVGDVGDAHPQMRVYNPRDPLGQPNAPSTPDDNWVDWKPLGFVYDYPDGPHGQTVSFATNAWQYRRLRFQRPNQTWVPRLLPTCYHADYAAQELDTSNRGGMNGGLSLLLALIALNVPSQLRMWLFTGGFQNGRWDLRGVHGHVGAQRHGWQDRHGVVVTVWAAPTSEPGGIQLALNRLRNFETGNTGKIFP